MSFRAFLYNLPKEWSEQQIKRELQEQTSSEVKVKVIKDSLGKSSGKAEVKFNTKEEMRNAINKLHIISRMGNKVVKIREFDSKHKEILNIRI